VIRILQAERFQMIEDLVNNNNVVTIKELCEKLRISKASVRRDLKILEERMKLIRAHGGAISISQGTSMEPPFKVKKDYHLDEKERIAEAAVKLIKPGETILLDAGTTTFELAKKLLNFKNLIVATNDIAIAMELSKNSNLTLIVIGGILKKEYYTLTGIFSEMILKEIRVDKSFIGTDAVDVDFGIMNFNMEEVPVKRLMINAAKEKIVLCDHSKFKNVAFINICHLDKIDKFITGKDIDQNILKKLQDKDIDITVV
jgi:DeoR family fructose operon transcriptional repressor